jgi:hypothetical protein
LSFPKELKACFSRRGGRSKVLEANKITQMPIGI